MVGIRPQRRVHMGHEVEHAVALQHRCAGCHGRTGLGGYPNNNVKGGAIPAIVGCGAELTTVKNDDLIIIDGGAGTVIINPDKETIAIYTTKQKEFLQQRSFLLSLKKFMLFIYIVRIF